MPCLPAIAHLVFLLAVLGVAAEARAQWLPPKADSLHSDVLDQERKIDVYLPAESAADPVARFETLYVLDGDWNAGLVADLVTFTHQNGFMPPVIVIGVHNHFDADGVDSRDHDFTPTISAEQPHSGGAADFLRFLKSELMPYVDAHYPSNGVNSIHGHSYGGLFVFYLMMNDPELFDGYVAIDPAMGWNQHMFDAILDAGLPTLPTKGKAIYVAARSGSALERMGMSAIEPIFERRAPANLHWEILAYEDETHDSLKLKGTYDALKFVYRGYARDPVAFVPASGTLIKGKPFSLHMRNPNARVDVRYTRDGSTPDASSLRPVDGALTIDDAERTRVRLLSNRGIYDRDLSFHLQNGRALSPVRASATAADDAWHIAYYAPAGWPNLRRARPFKQEETSQAPNFTDVGRDDFAATILRDLIVAADAYYVFDVESSDLARLFVDGKPLAESDGANDRREQSIVVPLLRGTHTLRLEFRHPAKDSDIDLSIFRADDAHPDWWKNRVMRLSGDGSH